ncbi:SURF1 family protein [Alsobacter sp. R-9]
MAARSRLFFLVPALFTLVGVGLLVALGAWQVERGGAKKRLIARVEQRVNEAPRPLPPEAAWAALSPKEYEYLRVTAQGTFRHDLEARMHGLRQPDRPGQPTLQGFYILTPLQLADGSTIIVNRGFVPTERGDPATRAAGQVAGPQTVTGLLRAPEVRGWFVPENDPAKNVWFTRDPGAIAAARGLTRVAPFVLEADATPVPGGLPVGGNTRISFPDNHLQYAITWFTLAIGLIVVFVVWLRQQARKPPEAEG